jgi:hypothetical protein
MWRLRRVQGSFYGAKTCFLLTEIFTRRTKKVQ